MIFNILNYRLKSSVLRYKRGITFVELLIAILIFSIIVTSLYSAFRVGLTAYKRGERFASCYQGIRLALDSIALDLRNSYKFSESDVRFKAEESKVSFYTLKNFTSEQHKDNFQICKIEYWKEDKELFRKVFAGNLAFSEEEVSAGLLLDNLSEFSIEFPYKDEEAQSVVWNDYWLASDELPLAVKIYLKIDEPETGQPIELTKIIYIPTGELGRPEE
ncbi:MAG: prepilin-type N-terminal cleavage/methylation domain-containing protein [Candidatus Omnitrophica bacterium]|nr:prepilin-type N-terminal cleavage/methylation domain-containing protein [Candidatus Omnitrophota bacterium]